MELGNGIEADVNAIDEFLGAFNEDERSRSRVDVWKQRAEVLAHELKKHLVAAAPAVQPTTPAAISTAHQPCLPVDELEYVREALHYLFRSGENSECHCSGELQCAVEDPKCDAMEIQRAIKTLEEMLTPPPSTSRPDRLLTSYTERIFYEEFGKQNRRVYGVDNGYTVLEAILSAERPEKDILGIPRTYNPPITRRDNYVAFSVIQWLGTNCGGSFLRRCEDRINAERKIHYELGGCSWRKEPDLPADSLESQYGGYIAGEFFTPDDSRYQLLVKRIASVLTHCQEIRDQQISA